MTSLLSRIQATKDAALPSGYTPSILPPPPPSAFTKPTDPLPTDPLLINKRSGWPVYKAVELTRYATANGQWVNAVDGFFYPTTSEEEELLKYYSTKYHLVELVE